MHVKATNRNEFLTCAQALMSYHVEGESFGRGAVSVHDDRRRASSLSTMKSAGRAWICVLSWHRCLGS